MVGRRNGVHDEWWLRRLIPPQVLVDHKVDQHRSGRRCIIQMNMEKNKHLSFGYIMLDCVLKEIPMNVLVACESSGVTRNAFRALGHDAYSCDLLPADDGSQWHIQGDGVAAIAAGAPNGGKWDLIICHPPCTHIACSGSRWFAEKRITGEHQAGIALFMAFVNACIASGAKWCIENPICVMSTKFRKPDQIVQPWQHGHPETKSTCYWLGGLPKLTPTNNVKEEMMKLPKKQRNRIHYASPGKDRWKIRSKSYEGIAKAMATQWSK